MSLDMMELGNSFTRGFKLALSDNESVLVKRLLMGYFRKSVKRSEQEILYRLQKFFGASDPEDANYFFLDIKKNGMPLPGKRILKFEALKGEKFDQDYRIYLEKIRYYS